MRPTLLLASLLIGIGSGAALAEERTAPMDGEPLSQQELLEAGKKIYLSGVLPDGEGIRAKVRGDVTLHGSQYACANCHRRSGIGSSEGGDLVPPVIGPSLFSPRVSGLHEKYTSAGMHTETRPAYTTETLGKALREGIDPTGRRLASLMPRFVLTDGEVLALSTYLASLTVALPPGVDEHVIHFATITTPGNDIARTAMLDVFNEFFRDKNAGTRNEIRRAQFAPFHKEWMYSAYRRWKLHVWDLSGPEQSWAAQLEALYAKQSVFALLGGVGSGNWQSIHRFCEEHELPCLMPLIPRPPAQADGDFYSIYFSRGVELEALALAKTLAAGTQLSQRAIQVLRDTPEARAAAETLRRALQEDGNTTVTDIVLETGQVLSADFWSTLARKHRDSAWVLWLDDADLQRLASSAADKPAAIYVSATLQRDITALRQHPLHSRFTLLSPYQPPGDEANTLRFRSWARVRKLPLSDLHTQSASFFTATLAGESLMHLRGNFSREYFIERIEHMMDNMINPSLYPRFSLAPGQRFAAKGCYVWGMGKPFDTAQWVVP